MIMAGFADVGASLWVFRSIQVSEVLELVVGLHVIVDSWTLPMRRLEGSVFWAAFDDFDFSVSLG
jgi:hypothetical protein